MDKIKFLMTDTGAQTTQLCRQALEAKGIDVTVCEKNGSQALKSLLEEHPQAVLLDAFMPDLDAITVKQRYETQDTRGGHTTFFVTGAFQSEEVEQDLLDNGFSFFFVKPFDENVLVSRVLKAAGSTSRPQPVSQDCDELTVTEILHQVGVPAHIKGYQFLRDAILLAVSDHDYINAVTKRLYPEIAKRNATTLPAWSAPSATLLKSPGTAAMWIPEQLLWLYHPQPERKTHEQRVHRNDQR